MRMLYRAEKERAAEANERISALEQEKTSKTTAKHKALMDGDSVDKHILLASRAGLLNISNASLAQKVGPSIVTVQSLRAERTSTSQLLLKWNE